jgi:hypothetical protein
MWHVIPLTWISNLFWDSKIRFDFKLNPTSAISNFRESQHLVRFVSRHNAMAYDNAASHTILTGGWYASKPIVPSQVLGHDHPVWQYQNARQARALTTAVAVAVAKAVAVTRTIALASTCAAAIAITHPLTASIAPSVTHACAHCP